MISCQHLSARNHYNTSRGQITILSRRSCAGSSTKAVCKCPNYQGQTWKYYKYGWILFLCEPQPLIHQPKDNRKRCENVWWKDFDVIFYKQASKLAFFMDNATCTQTADTWSLDSGVGNVPSSLTFGAFPVGGGRAITDLWPSVRLSADLSQPTSQSVTPRNPPAGSRVCQKHLFHLLRGKPAVNAWSTQNNPHAGDTRSFCTFECFNSIRHQYVLLALTFNFPKSAQCIFKDAFWSADLDPAAKWPSRRSLSSLSDSSLEWPSSPLGCGRGVKRWVVSVGHGGSCSRASRPSVAFLNRRGMSRSSQQCVRWSDVPDVFILQKKLVPSVNTTKFMQRTTTQAVRRQTQQLHNKIMQDKSLNLSNKAAMNTICAPFVWLDEMIWALKSETCSSVTWSEWCGCVGSLEIARVGFQQFDSWGHSALLSSFFLVLCCWELTGNLFPPRPQSSGDQAADCSVFRSTPGGLNVLAPPKKRDYFCSTHFSGFLNPKSRLTSAVECSCDDTDLAFDSSFHHGSHWFF